MIALLLISAALQANPSGEKEEPLSLLGRMELRCPACGKPFITVVCVQSNTRCGVDRDLFARALGPQPEFYRISTCPTCGYSGYLSDFADDVRLPPHLLDRILRAPKLALPPGFGPASDPHDLDASARYALAVTCYRWARRSDEALGWLYLRSSWVEREQGSHLFPDPRLKRVLDYIERWRPPIGPTQNQLDIEMQLATRTAEAVLTGRFNRFQKPYVELAVALLLRRHGENIQAGTILRRLQGPARTDFSDDLRQSIAAMIESLGRERAFQQQAADAFERALLADLVPTDNRGPACYLLGELYRRLGRDAEARQWLDRALRDPTLPSELSGWATEQKRLCLSTPRSRP